MTQTILAVDTSGPYCAAAILKDNTVIASAHEDMKRGQAERLMPLINKLLERAQIEYSDLTLLAVGTGPGNFTGIRIGVSAVRGLALGLKIPAMGVSRFEVLRRDGDQKVVVAGPRDVVYVQDFDGRSPVGAPSISENVLPSPVVTEPAPIIGHIALSRWQSGETTPDRPAPLYVKAADAAPPRDPAPLIIA